jgi:ribulose-phosphate 3-epimerase
MASVVPAVIPESEAHLTDTLSAVLPWSPEIQVDIVDGLFVPHTSWPYKGGAVHALSAFSNTIIIEVDLMVQEPETVVESYLQAGVKRVVVHLESVKNLAVIVALKQKYPFLLGFSIGNDTPLETLQNVVGYADYVQLMGIASIGAQGQSFDTRVLDRIRAVRHAHGTLPISIDGSVNTATIEALVEVGADRLVSGSAILSADEPDRAYQTLAHLASS